MIQGYITDSISRESMYRRAVQLEEEAREALKGINNNTTEFIMWNAILGERTAFKHDIMDAKSTRPQWIEVSDREPDTEEDGYYYVAVTSDAYSVDYKVAIDNWKRYPNGSHYWEGEVSKKHRVHAWVERPYEYDPYMMDIHSMPKENFQERRNIGYWILCDEQDPIEVQNNNYRYTCSCCSASDIHAASQEVPYCWSCGAKMLGKGKGADV